MTLQESLAHTQPVYEIPNDNLVEEVMIPAMSVADEVKVGTGFFTSHCFTQLAPGLAAFLRTKSQKLKLLASPELDDQHWKALDQAVHDKDTVLQSFVGQLLRDATASTAALMRHTLECLAYLIAADRLELRFVLMERGMYHKKLWLFRHGSTWAAVHGSGNATSRGLLVNGEQMTVDRPWMDGLSSESRVNLLLRRWNQQWDNLSPYSLTLLAEQGLSLASIARTGNDPPTVSDFWEAWHRDYENGLEALPPMRGHPATKPARFFIPEAVDWSQGRYAHQSIAVRNFLEAQGRGILAIATGGGKTRTALIAAHELQKTNGLPLLIILVVPTRPLALQWTAEVRAFGLQPTFLSEIETNQRRSRLQEVNAALSVMGRVEVILMTNSLFTNDDTVPELLHSLDRSVSVLFIGDEVHNLGAPSALARLPPIANYRLGLSATPLRQYDPDGTEGLLSYFGPTIFEFSIGDAISSGCLTPYDYHLIEVRLSDEEMDRWVDLTEELSRSGFRVEDEGQTQGLSPKIERLLRERRAVLEQASAKLTALHTALLQIGPRSVSRCLVYCSAKPPFQDRMRQIESVNLVLQDLGITSHQFTNEETATRGGQDILAKFTSGDYQALTAMKVLDEGLDVPATDTAFLLASTTVRREWVQRRGRILRHSPGKTRARLFDFLTLPSNASSREGRAIVRAELRRAEEFASTAANEWDTNGPRETMNRYDNIAWKGTESP